MKKPSGANAPLLHSQRAAACLLPSPSENLVCRGRDCTPKQYPGRARCLARAFERASFASTYDQRDRRRCISSVEGAASRDYSQ